MVAHEPLCSTRRASLSGISTLVKTESAGSWSRLDHDSMKTLRCKLVVQVAERDDKIDDPSIAWPDTRKKVELGTITITKAVADSQAAEKKLLFMPGALVPGIEAADPMIAAWSAAIIVSLSRRSQVQ